MAYLYDGQSTTFNFGTTVSLLFREKRVQPPDVDGGGRVDSTDMRNLRGRTAASKKLFTSGQMKTMGYYDPLMYTNFVSNMQVNQGINVLFPDFSMVTFYGWLEKFTPQEHQEGENPLAEVIIEISNQNGAGRGVSGAEVLPVYAAPIQNGGVPLNHGQ